VFSHRFYQQATPAVGEYVVATVTRVDPNVGAFVSLAEYQRREALIVLNEVSKKRIRSIKQVRLLTPCCEPLSLAADFCS
jgi:translation initiation factor 2 subunit 1